MVSPSAIDQQGLNSPYIGITSQVFNIIVPTIFPMIPSASGSFNNSEIRSANCFDSLSGVITKASLFLAGPPGGESGRAAQMNGRPDDIIEKNLLGIANSAPSGNCGTKCMSAAATLAFSEPFGTQFSNSTFPSPRALASDINSSARLPLPRVILRADMDLPIANRVQLAVQATFLCGQCRGEHPLFKQTGGFSVSFQVSGINLKLLGHIMIRRKAREDPVKDTHLTPADKTVIKGFVRTIFLRSVTLLKATFQHINNAADQF